MLTGISGSLLSLDALSSSIPAALGAAFDGGGREAAYVRLRAWHRRVAAQLGPAASARVLFDRLAAPLLNELGFGVELSASATGGSVRGVLRCGRRPCAAFVVTPWGEDGGGVWREGARLGISLDVRWCVLITGPFLRVIDARRTYSRRFAEFDLDRALRDPSTFSVLWGLLRADAFTPAPLLDRAVHLSEQHRTSVRVSLQSGVHVALTELLRAFSRTGPRRSDAASRLDESLVVVYRILFLLFAEARGLVPRWHPVYRAGYTIDALRPRVEREQASRGLWETLQAISRLAHHGCRAGSLVVPPFNGRLFSPQYAPLAESAVLDDTAVRSALLALTTVPARGARERIAYADLGVEQLGGIYERVLDFAPSVENGAVSLVRVGRRKATGSFYTPRSITEYLVRRTLAPLVRDRTPEAILQLRILDPAMGSGAFLVAACRYLAIAYEQALTVETGLHPADITDGDRAGFRRTIAQRCLYGVDLNPMAVQLARLSLWLATLASDRPLTFLDHHLRTGNSLAGASIADIQRQVPGAGHHGRARPLPLFEDAATGALKEVVGLRLRIEEEPGDTLEAVRSKERALALLDRDSDLRRWMKVADLWCSAWFGTTVAPRMFPVIADELLGRSATLPPAITADVRAAADSIAAKERFLHWTLEFPEVFFDSEAVPRPRAGFDAVIGNPPWEMLRADAGAPETRHAAALSATHMTTFARTSGIYTAQGDGHANLYQMFLERAMSLVADGGRLGMILPAGFGSDTGCARLRRRLLDRMAVDSFVSVENRDGLFPIHRSLKFLLLTATAGASTSALPCRFGVRSLEALDAAPEDGIGTDAVLVPREMLERVSGADQFAIPEFRTQQDCDITARVTATVPPLGDASGWNARFGRELNATDDRPCFAPLHRPGRLLPVIEGKSISPFKVHVDAATFGISKADAIRLLPSRPFDRPRLAYRDVASSTNRLTLIAAILPAGVVTTHTLFCLKTDIDEESQQYLSAIFNSYVANYLVRMRVGTHVTVAILQRLPVPRPPRQSAAFRELAQIAGSIAQDRSDRVADARLQALAAGLYGLRRDDFDHVLDTFPLVDLSVRREAAAAFGAMTNAI